MEVWRTVDKVILFSQDLILVLTAFWQIGWDGTRELAAQSPATPWTDLAIISLTLIVMLYYLARYWLYVLSLLALCVGIIVFL